MADPRKAFPPTDGLWLRWSIASIWLATGIGVIHPYYRQVGHEYLARFGLPDGVMHATCLGEVLLGLRVGLGRMTTWLAIIQVALVVGFTSLLTWVDPWLWVHPYGILSKNVPLLPLIGAAWLWDREGWSPRAVWLLRGGIAFIWIAEGLAKILFQQPPVLELLAMMGLSTHATLVLVLGGGLELASGVVVLLANGRLLRFILLSQILGLIVFPIIVTLYDPLAWFHPFGPLTKNIPILGGTLLLFRRTRIHSSLVA